MTSLPHGTLPLATTPAFTPRACAPVRDPSAWAQALARAAASAAPAKAGPASGVRALVDAVRPPPSAAGSLSAGGPVASASAPRPAPAGLQPACARTLAAPAPDPTPAIVDARALAWAHLQAQAVPDLPANEPGEEVHPSPRARPLGHEPAGPRVHVELRDEGLAIWLGLDAGSQAAAARAAGVLEELRRHAAGLPRLALLVCNGTPVPTRPLSSKETP